MLCACCGEEIKGTPKGPYNGNQFYCKECWNNPNLFFEDKMKNAIKQIFYNTRFELDDPTIFEAIDMFRSNSINPNINISNFYKENFDLNVSINVIKLRQKNVPIYIGKLNVIQLLIMASSEQWDESSMDGYQRQVFKEKAKEIRTYLEKCPIPLIPAILVSFRQGQFISNDDTFGTLRLPLIPGLLSIIDGQQRTFGFEEIFRSFREDYYKNTSDNHKDLIIEYINLINYEVPIVFIDTQEIIKLFQKETSSIKIEPLDIERAFFFVINKTQKSVNPSLKDQLAYRTLSIGINGIPAVEKEKWRAEIVPIANELNRNTGPLHGLINLSGKTGLRKPIPLNAFVSSLRPLFVTNQEFKKLSFYKKQEYIEKYWNAIMDVFSESFYSKKKTMLTKSIGVFALNYLSNDIFNKCVSEKKDPFEKENLKNYINKLKTFDWDVKTSPLAFLGGKKGVAKAHEILLNLIGMCS